MSQTYNIRIPFGDQNEAAASMNIVSLIGQGRYFSLSEDFMNELIRYVNRNKIKCGDYPAQVCLKCLKAHTNWLLAKEGIDDDIAKRLLSSFGCKMGHNGYYQDKHVVRKIE